MRSLFALALFASTTVASPPTFTSLFPSGAQRGTTLEATATGAFDSWPVNVWCNNKNLDVKPLKNKGKFTITVAADAPVGTHWIRLYNSDGASDLRPFIVSWLPEISEVEPNDDPKKPQAIPPGNFVVNGRLNPAGDVDHFALELKKGQTLIASLQANSILRSPMDAIMQILSADGFVLAENNDVHGLDPQIAFRVPRNGRYIVRVYAFPSQPDTAIRFSGGETYVYRLTLTTGGFADHAYPLAISLKQPGRIELRGWNIPDAAKSIALNPDRIDDKFIIAHPDVANPVDIRVEPHSCITEAAPNDRSRPQKITIPCTVSGHIDPPGDIDVFDFDAKKGQTLSIQIESKTIGSALDPVLKFVDATGKAIHELNDQSGTADPKLDVNIAADGRYRVKVHDLQFYGGERYYYRLRIYNPVPDYSLTVAADQFMITDALEIPITVERRAGYALPIEIKAVDLPSGVKSTNITADVKTTSVKLKLEAANVMASGAFRIVGSSPAVAGTERVGRAKLPAFDWITEASFLTAKPAQK